MKAMAWEHNNDTRGQHNPLAFAAGMIGGVMHFIMNIQFDVDFLSKLIEAAITAAVCGFVGIAGKEIFVVAKNSFKEYMKARRERRKTLNDSPKDKLPGNSQ